jgi:hypothetical protein
MGSRRDVQHLSLLQQSCDKIVKHVSLSEKQRRTEEDGLCCGWVFSRLAERVKERIDGFG